MVRFLLATISFAGFGNFSAAAFGTSMDGIQQAAITGSWLLIAVLCLTSPPRIDIDRNWTTLFCLSLVYVWFSALWSDSPIGSVTKATVLIVNSSAAVILCTRVPLSAILPPIRQGLVVLLLVCIAVVFLVPSVGLHDDWQHAGKWRGILGQKQLLGAASVVLGLLAIATLTRHRRILAVALAITCVVGSQSRNSLVLLVLVVVGSLLVVRMNWAQRMASFMPVVLAAFAFGMFMWMLATDAVALDWIGEGLTITGRTFIWNFALQAWQVAPVGGYGVNGFWQDRLVDFRADYGWALDNFHSGYLAALVEGGGVLYMTLFALVVLQARSAMTVVIGASTRGAPVASFVVIYPIYFAVLNLSETFWYRSTSVFFTLLVISAVSARSFGSPAQASGEGQTLGSDVRVGIPAPGVQIT